MRLPGINVEHVVDSDDSHTPPYIIGALGVDMFDLDPATVPGGVPWIPARKIYTIQDDGLLQPWGGLVWLNPPYSEPGPWIEKLAYHGHGIALLPVDTSTAWWHRWVLVADVICFLRHRPRFVRGDTSIGSARFPAALVGYGNGAAHVEQCGLGWVVTL